MGDFYYGERDFNSLRNMLGLAGTPSSLSQTNINHLPHDKVIEGIRKQADDEDTKFNTSLREAVEIERKIQALKDRRQQFNDMKKQCSEIVHNRSNLSYMNSIIDAEIEVINSEIGMLV